MGADLYESYVGALAATMTIAATLTRMTCVAVPRQPSAFNMASAIGIAVLPATRSRIQLMLMALPC